MVADFIQNSNTGVGPTITYVRYDTADAGAKSRLLDHLYRDTRQPSCFTSLEPLYAEAQKYNQRMTREDVKDFLSRTSTYTLHRRVVRKFRRLPTLASGLHTDWQADLCILADIARKNRGYQYLLVCIDTLSRQMFVAPVRKKTSELMVEAFECIFKKSKYVPWKLFTDSGLEFTSNRMKAYWKEKGILHFCMLTSPKFHAGMVERANRTIKERLYRYFTQANTFRWLEVIDPIVNSINASYCRSIDAAPRDVTFENAEALRKRLLVKAQAIQQGRKRRFEVDDFVRIEKSKHIFQKGYLPNFTDELYTVAKVNAHSRPITYRLVDSSGEPMLGLFYANELCLVRLDPQHTYEVHKIIDQKERDGVLYYYIKWKGKNARHNTWVRASDVQIGG
jgi:hypothetical protein